MKYFSLVHLPSVLSTTSAVVETATPNGLCASYVMSPVSSGYTWGIVSIDVPSSKFSIRNSFDGIISSPCFNHLPIGFGFPTALTSNLQILVFRIKQIIGL